MVTIEKEVKIELLDKIANLAIIKEYRVDNEPIYIFDLYYEEKDTKELLASDRFAFVDKAPFELTKEELNNLRGII